MSYFSFYLAISHKIIPSYEGFFFGSLLIILLINLIFFFKLRDLSYLLFSIYTSFLIVSEIAVLENNLSLKLFSTLLSYSFFILLSNRLLGFENKNSSIYKFFQYFAYFFLFISFPILVSNYYFESILNYQFSIHFFYLLVSLFIISIALKRKLIFSKILFLSVFFILIENLMVFFYEKIGFNYRLGSFFSGLLIAYALLLHFINKLKDTQQQVIFNLEEMNSLNENANLKLDEKVKQRTFELQKVNDLLSEQNREINTQKNEIEDIVQTLEDANEQIIEQKELIEETHLKITESINSASHIQTAMLPRNDLFENHFKDFFIFYKPRDIVSGDFYWVKKIKNQIIITAADCTGHGVPGAFVSMLGISMLNEIVRKKEAKTAGLILDELRTTLKLSLQQKGSDNEAKEGIDMVLCIIDLDTKMLQYAGANNSIYIIRKKKLNELSETDKIKIHSQVEGRVSDNILIEVKGNHQPIGAYRKERPFTNYKIQLLEGDNLYLFSDGFVDQFGGEKGYKYRTRPFKNLLLDIQDTDLKEQKTILIDSFNNWRGTLRQLDDVLVMGLKI